MRKALAMGTAVVSILLLGAGPAFACGGLIGPSGGVNLVRTSTLAAYHDGIEHYVTSFEFAGGGAKFGSIVPLPGIPSKVIKGGDWTLQRLALEVQPVVAELAFKGASRSSADMAEVLQEVRIDSLNITILKGGGDEVGRWAEANGFNLSPDAPEVLDFYGQRSPIFMAAAFDAKAARADGFGLGDGTPVHLVIPTPNPWVPLRILGLGKEGVEPIEADVFLLTDRAPAMLPEPASPGTFSTSGLVMERSEPASDLLLSDLRSDRGMKWLPSSDMWLSYLRVDATAGDLKHDLAIDASGQGQPSRVAAGFELPSLPRLPEETETMIWAWVLAAFVALGGIAAVNSLAGGSSSRA